MSDKSDKADRDLESAVARALRGADLQPRAGWQDAVLRGIDEAREQRDAAPRRSTWRAAILALPALAIALAILLWILL